jgi:DNA-binding protein Fis
MAEVLGGTRNRLSGTGVPDLQAATGGFQAESELLENALRAAGGNKTAAAASLGMKPSTFRDKLAKHGLG